MFIDVSGSYWDKFVLKKFFLKRKKVIQSITILIFFNSEESFFTNEKIPKIEDMIPMIVQISITQRYKITWLS